MSKKTEALVTKGAKLKEEIAKLTADLKTVEGQLIESGAGAYVTPEGKKATVVAANDSVFSFPKGLDDQLAARKLTGKHAPKLFTKVVSYKPAKGLLDAAKLVLPARAFQKLQTLCTSKKTAYIIWS